MLWGLEDRVLSAILNFIGFTNAMNKSIMRRGQIREFQGIQFVYARQWPEGPCIVPIVADGEPRTTTEFRSQTGKGKNVVVQCWNVRNISNTVASQSRPSSIGRLSLREVNRMWRVVQHAFTGKRVPRRIAKDTGQPVTTAVAYHDLAKYQRKWAHKVHPIQADLFKKYG